MIPVPRLTRNLRVIGSPCGSDGSWQTWGTFWLFLGNWQDSRLLWRLPMPDEIALTRLVADKYLVAIRRARVDNLVMPRTARASVGGYCYHALNRGNGRSRVFHDADDYHAFLPLLRE